MASTWKVVFMNSQASMIELDDLPCMQLVDVADSTAELNAMGRQ